MLRPDFYTLTSFSSNGSSLLEATFLVQPEHAIFAGHFPGQPIVPGVCMLQIIKECLEQAVGHKLMLAQAANIKFLTMLVPEAGKEISLRAEFTVSTEILVSTASLHATADTFIKLSNARYLLAEASR